MKPHPLPEDPSGLNRVLDYSDAALVAGDLDRAPGLVYPERLNAAVEFVDTVETLARERAKLLFGAEHANVQPHSGTQANMAVYFTLLKPGDTVLGMNLAHGGHLTHGHPLNFSGRYFKVVAYGVASVSGTILAVCSCTVLPLFAGIHKRGAGLGPAIAFLYSGPAINVLAIVLTARVLGIELGTARAIGAVAFSVIVGFAMHLVFRREEQAKAEAAAEIAFTVVLEPGRAARSSVAGRAAVRHGEIRLLFHVEKELRC
mgnify:CR=1 FL=1